MEEAKQKKRSKKKKNKQLKAAEDSVQTSSHQGGNNGPDPNHPTRSCESHTLHESLSNGISEFPVEEIGHLGNGSNGSTLETKEKQDWIKEEARLKVMIKELQLERESQIQKEAELEMELSKLQEEKDVSQRKKISFEEKISELMQEKDILCMEETKLLEKVRFLEREKALWIREEDSIKQKSAALNDENTRMRVQVMELEECRNQLSLEKQQLMENLSSLQSRLEDLERSSASAHSSTGITNDALKIDDLNSQIEAACQLVEKLITDNADLVEKMNELYAELGHWQAKDGDSVISVPDSLTVNVHAAASQFESESVNGLSLLAENANRSDEVSIREERSMSDHSNEYYSAVNRKLSDTTVPGEIVQILLDENVAQDLEGQALMQEKIDGIPLSDSPLVGAPFRLISFVAKYVSGADLVGDNSNSVQER